MMMTTEKVRTFSLGGSNSESGQQHHNNSSNQESTTAAFGHEVIPGGAATSSSSAAVEINSVMNLSQTSTDSSMRHFSSYPSSASCGPPPPPAAAASAGQQTCRFPKLEECAHFHYERVQLGAIVVRVVDEKTESTAMATSLNDSSRASTSSMMGLGGSSSNPGNSFSFILRVSARRSEPFLIKRSFENLKMLDALLHQCVYDRKVSGLRDVQRVDLSLQGSRQSIEGRASSVDDLDDVEDNVFTPGTTRSSASAKEETEDRLTKIVANYFNQFSAIASDAMTCGPVLTWLQLDNKGRRLPVADMDTMTTINTPAVGAAYGVRKYQAQACDEISIEVGDMISVIDMPSPAESVWWRGKKSLLQKNHYEVGFFPQSCVATIGEKIPRHMPLPAPLVGSLAVSPTKPVLRKHGKLIAFFRSFILARPSRRRLKQSGIYKERVFSCDLSEHLLNSRQDIPMVLRCCAEFLEQYGVVDGIYRLSGITSNIQRLRRAFDEERVPDLSSAEIKQDIHAVSSLLKMYFRELPNPLCTYQLYDRFVEAIQAPVEGDAKLRGMKETVQKLPPPHYRTLKYLANHLHRIAKHAPNTGMTDRNLAIVWAPNLLRSPALESGGVAALRGVGVQAVVTEYLITHSESIFDEDFVQLVGHEALCQESMTDNDSLISGSGGDHREAYDSLSMLPVMAIERPKSLNVSGGTKLISLEEAQSRQQRVEQSIDKELSVNTPKCTSYIEVGGGPSSLPDKYHTVLPVPRHWQKRKTHSWKSLFMRGGQNSSSRPPPSGGVAIGNPQRVLTAKDIKVIMNNPCDAAEKPEKLQRKDSKMGRKDKLQMSEKEQSQMTKSVDVFDAKAVISMDVCVRSNSVDSLRTAGHSRSVSHDSYFDLLQSPLRGIVNCPSRELSELGMNFDREEPEMRLFSESESLVSSPRIPKEHQANGGGNTSASSGHASRRVLRSRPDEFSNTASINPSPKKQPRLNIPAANAAAADMSNWGPMSMDESIMCKRYKLEDQLSDIQFIDCNTPEHQVGAVNPTAYSSTSSLSNSFNATMNKFNTNAQVHAPPAIVVKKVPAGDGLKSPLNRFSYPQYGMTTVTVNQDDHHVQIRTSDFSASGGPRKGDSERFSYPGERRENKRYGYQQLDDQDDQSDSLVKSVMDHFNSKLELPKGGLSSDPSQQSLQTIVTPSSPSHSLRYSLLGGNGGGDTSSENFSESGSVGNLLTPGVVANVMETSVSSATKLIGRQATTSGGVSVCESNPMVMSMEDEMVDEHTRDPNNEGDVIHDVDLEKTFVDISALKRKFSLDLLAESPPGRSDIDKAQKTLNLSTPNTPNVTANSGGATTTSQSASPSEFGYQHLNRMSNIGTPSTPTEFMVGGQEVKSSSGQIPGSPIKSTICITYNTKSPTTSPPRSRGASVLKSNDVENSDDYEVIEVDRKEQQQQERHEEKEESLLETSFDDENMVYEQVKFFKSAVSAINDLVEGGGGSGEVTPKAKEAPVAAQIVPEADMERCRDSNQKVDPPKNQIEEVILRMTKERVDASDVSMMSTDVPLGDHLEDSLEFDNHLSLYENVIVEKPAAFYENVEVRRSMVHQLMPEEPVAEKVLQAEVTVNVKVAEEEEEPERPKGKFLVKQLATKFETSPVDPQPPFDFTKSGSGAVAAAAGLLLRRDNSSGAVNRPEGDRNRMTAPASGPVMILKNNTNSSPRAIAKSLDENAFVREFGAVKILDKFSNIDGGAVTQENNQNSENINGTNGARRSGGSDYAKPKSLNPPKKLPLFETGATAVVGQTAPVSIVESCKAAIRSKDDPMSKSSPYLAQRITPTTENRISLIQHHAEGVKDEVDDKTGGGGGTGGGAVQLRDCKLDRDRIERIKEERRLQLNEKFRSESFKGENDTIKLKSKSKTELRASEKGDAIIHHSTSTLDRTTLRSKSKVDIAREKDEEKLKRFSATNKSEEQLSWIGGGGDRRSLLIQDRIRRVSEGKGAGAGDEVKDAVATNANWKLRNKFEKRASSGNGQVMVAATNGRERDGGGAVESIIQRNMEQQREACSPQFSIKDVAAIFESRSQN